MTTANAIQNQSHPSRPPDRHSRRVTTVGDSPDPGDRRGPGGWRRTLKGQSCWSGLGCQTFERHTRKPDRARGGMVRGRVRPPSRLQRKGRPHRNVGAARAGPKNAYRDERVSISDPTQPDGVDGMGGVLGVDMADHLSKAGRAQVKLPAMLFAQSVTDSSSRQSPAIFLAIALAGKPWASGAKRPPKVT
jgi:hypothetical protein